MLSSKEQRSHVNLPILHRNESRYLVAFCLPPFLFHRKSLKRLEYASLTSKEIIITYMKRVTKQRHAHRDLLDDASIIRLWRISSAEGERSKSGNKGCPGASPCTTLELLRCTSGRLPWWTEHSRQRRDGPHSILRK